MNFLRMGASEDQWSVYMDYIESVRALLPEEVYQFIHAPWHYDFSFHRCPHDAWVERIVVAEEAQGERHQVRHAMIEVHLLGSFHDGHITFRYSGVRRYSIQGALQPLSSREPPSWHGSWLIDEVRVAPSGHVVHEIAFDSGASIVIECETISHSTNIPDSREDL